MAVQSPQSRAIRVFLSSTFRDMQAERDELRKQIFPQLRKLCESRGVTWGELDLRWGIDTSDETRAEEKVLRTCLDEVERCRPFFIGMLGERYGWVPDEFPPALVERESWLAEQLGRSVTELEILHGALNEPAQADHAHFYLRSPSYIDTLPPKEQPGFREVPTSEEIERLGADEAARRAEERRQKLAALKERIGGSGFPVREDYTDPVALGELVLTDLTAVIDSLYPEGSELEPLDREATEHRIFAQSRFGVYIGREEYFERLDAHVQGEGPPLVVLGESGSGKSALLANWAERYRGKGVKERDEELFLLHFIGATPASADWAAMLRRVLGEFQRCLGVEIKIPDQPEALRATFANALVQAAARGRVALMLDALNQLEDRDQAPDLVWLPPVIPENVRFIFSTLPGRPLNELSKRGWPTLRVEPLEPEERKRLIAEYLVQSGRQLSRIRLERIATAPQCANPLFLRALLEELTLWGNHDTLDEPIDRYLSATDPEDLYAKILARYEKDYERERPGLVKDAMSLLWAARRGLTEAELLDLLGADGEPLPAGHWSPLHLAADKALVCRSGYIGFFHDHLRRAVHQQYLPEESDQATTHLRLADYFGGRELDSRKVDELPWQLAHGRAWERLSKLLADLDFLQSAWDHDHFEVKAYWAQVERQSQHRLLDAYSPILQDPVRDPWSAQHVADLLRDTGHLEESLALWRQLAEWARERGYRAELQRSLNNQAVILDTRGELDEALALLKEVEELSYRGGDIRGRVVSLGNQALILRQRGELDEAMALHKEAEQLYRREGDKAGLHACLGNQALILRARGELDEAMALQKENERLWRELGDKSTLSESLGNQAVILKQRGELDAAMALLKEQEQICRELGDKAGLMASLGNQALIFHARGELDEAMALHREEERLCRELGNPKGLAISLANQAAMLAEKDDRQALPLLQEAHELAVSLGLRHLASPIKAILKRQASGLRARGELDEASALMKEVERLCRELGDKEGVVDSLWDQAVILRDRGEPDAGTELMKELERVSRELGDEEGIVASLGNQALLLLDRGELDAAMALLKEVEQLCRELGNKASLSFTLGNQAGILRGRGELDAAMALLKEVEQLCRELGDEAGLSESLGNQAVILQERGELDAALAVLKEWERLCRELDDKAALLRSLNNQAVILHKRGELDEAMALLREVERLCRELGDNEKLVGSLGNQALILWDRGELDAALALLKEGERLCRELGDKAALSLTLGNQGMILRDRGELDAALAVLKEWERLCRELGDKAGLSRALDNQALILHARGKLDAAMALNREAEQLCRELGDEAGLSCALGLQALILQARGEVDEAMALHKEVERLCRELGDETGLSRALGNQAAILRERGNLNEALALHKEQERLSRELGDRAGLQSSLGNQAEILANQAETLQTRCELEAAMALRKELVQLCRELGSPEHLAVSLFNQAVILFQGLGRPREALPLLEEANELAERSGLRPLASQTRTRLDQARMLVAAPRILRLIFRFNVRVVQWARKLLVRASQRLARRM